MDLNECVRMAICVTLLKLKSRSSYASILSGMIRQLNVSEPQFQLII